MENQTEQTIFLRSKKTRRSLMNNVGFFMTENEKIKRQKRLSHNSLDLSVDMVDLDILENQPRKESLMKKFQAHGKSLSRKLSNQKLRLNRKFNSKTRIEETLPPKNCPNPSQSSRKRILSTSNGEQEINYDVVIWEETFAAKPTCKRQKFSLQKLI